MRHKKRLCVTSERRTRSRKEVNRRVAGDERAKLTDDERRLAFAPLRCELIHATMVIDENKAHREAADYQRHHD